MCIRDRTGAEVASYCGDREKFIGRYHGYESPAGVMNGNLGNELSYNENGCGALTATLTLEPGETKEIAFILGMKYKDEADKILAGYRNPSETCAEEFHELTAWWHEKLSHFQVKTPDASFNTMINTWNAYNCFMTFLWSRAASFIYCGLRNGYGYRDTVQDIQGIIPVSYTHLDVYKRQLIHRAMETSAMESRGVFLQTNTISFLMDLISMNCMI